MMAVKTSVPAFNEYPLKMQKQLISVCWYERWGKCELLLWNPKCFDVVFAVVKGDNDDTNDVVVVDVVFVGGVVVVAVVVVSFLFLFLSFPFYSLLSFISLSSQNSVCCAVCTLEIRLSKGWLSIKFLYISISWKRSRSKWAQVSIT